MQDSELETQFSRICKKKPSLSAMQAFRDYPDRHAAIDFLVGKLEEYLFVTRSVSEWKSAFDFGAVNACRLLGEMKAPEAIDPLIEILDDVKDEYLAYIYSAVMFALEGMGPHALEPAYERYDRDRANPEHAGVWLHVLSKLGVRDDRIPPALRELMKADPAQAAMLMGDYGDPALIPPLEEFVQKTADRLNAEQIDPFAVGPRLLNPWVSHYTEAVESLVMLQEGVPHSHPAVRAGVEALDRRLLKHLDFGVNDPSQPPPGLEFARAMSSKIGRNAPCPCGSGKKYKRCCEKL